MISKSKAVQAAGIIQTFCKEQKMNCSDCPFGSDCLFKYCPSSWRLNRVHLYRADIYDDTEDQ